MILLFDIQIQKDIFIKNIFYILFERFIQEYFVKYKKKINFNNINYYRK